MMKENTQISSNFYFGALSRDLEFPFPPLPFAAMPGTASSLKFPVVKDLLASSKEVSLFDDVY